MGVLFSGAAYVPVAISTPKDRMSYLLESIDAEVIISKPSLCERLILPRQIKIIQPISDPNKLDESKRLNDVHGQAICQIHRALLSGATLSESSNRWRF